MRATLAQPDRAPPPRPPGVGRASVAACGEHCCQLASARQKGAVRTSGTTTNDTLTQGPGMLQQGAPGGVTERACDGNALHEREESAMSLTEFYF